MTVEDYLRFVIYVHFTHHHHFDFRLEKEGELKSSKSQSGKNLSRKKPLVGKR